MTACTPSSQIGLVGKWKMTHYLADPGDGSGTWQAASEENPSVLEFRTDGTLAESGNSGSKYKIMDDSTVVFIRDTDSIRVGFRIEGKQLTLNPPCIEPCGQRFTRMD